MCQRFYIAKGITLKIKGNTATSQMKEWLYIVHVWARLVLRIVTSLLKGAGKSK